MAEASVKRYCKKCGAGTQQPAWWKAWSCKAPLASSQACEHGMECKNLRCKLHCSYMWWKDDDAEVGQKRKRERLESEETQERGDRGAKTHGGKARETSPKEERVIQRKKRA